MAAGWWPRHRTIVGWLSFSVCMGGGELVGTWQGSGSDVVCTGTGTCVNTACHSPSAGIRIGVCAPPQARAQVMPQIRDEFEYGSLAHRILAFKLLCTACSYTPPTAN